ncbi:hypothetical protein V496_04779 [Pseudogymnoascus sp. VKM F-4515 (FW-2607)]|nr:hypothetical protein V496_04779 [Pseudogymnoascus sp. VKM F-4515 (FW-2607)]KFY94334.1 hypothetical protein V498_03916 [Pseudogymnoascus sp. VKM F-4517 (FW-2822)]
MSLHEKVLRDLYGDELSYEYHQDYHGDESQWRKYLNIGIPTIILIGAITYSTLYSLDYNLLSLPELFWNWIVHLTPSRLIDILDKETRLNTTSANPRRVPRTHAAKSEIMRRAMGLDGQSSILGTVGTVAQASRRRLSSISGINLVAQGQEGIPAGLGNWDNSCYQNSVLQGLASLDSFSNYLNGPGSQKNETKDDSEMKMADSLRDLIARLKDPSNNGKRIWTPAALKSMSSWQQQDAQEYFSKVLDEIDKEIEKAVGQFSNSPGLTTKDQAEPVAKKAKSSPSELMPTSTVRNPLEGLLAQRVGCTRCGYSEGLSMIPFNCLTVPLGKSWSYDISQCLDEYTDLESIEGVQCGKCTLLKTKRLLKMLADKEQNLSTNTVGHQSVLERLRVVEEALEDDDYEDKTLTQKCKIPPKNRMTSTKSRQAVIARPPKSLVIHVNRSMFDEMTGELKKNYAEVKFQNRLDLGPWCLGSNGKAPDDSVEEWLLDPAESMIASRRRRSRIRGPSYELRAVVTHFGRHENGHYIAYRKHPAVEEAGEEADEEPVKEKTPRRSQWWRLSDDDVSRVSEDNVLNQGGVFMLFYDLVETSSLAVEKSDTSPVVEKATQPSEFMAFINSQHPGFLSKDTTTVDQEVTEDSSESVALPNNQIVAENTPETAAQPGSQVVAEGSSEIIAQSGNGVSNEEEKASEKASDDASEDTSEVEADEKADYEPVEPIHIKPYVRQAGRQHDEGRRKSNVQGSSGGMVMV